MFELGRVEATREHLLADTLEVAIAFLDRQEISLTDAVGILNTSLKSKDELLNATDTDADDNGFPDDLGEVEVNSRIQGYVENAFHHLGYRAAALGEDYPFELHEEVLRLKGDLSDAQKLYLLLLACARSRTFKSETGLVQKIADCFEEISAACLREIISPHGRVYMFGPNTDDRKNVFGSALSEALPALAKVMGMDMAPGWSPPKGASGDGKIDLVGIYDFGDIAPGYCVVVGQCASMEDEKNWQKKRQEADLSSKLGTFHFLVCPTPFLFFPTFYRSGDGSWIDRDFVSAVVPIDRFRLMKTIGRGEALLPVDEMFKKLGLPLSA